MVQISEIEKIYSIVLADTYNLPHIPLEEALQPLSEEDLRDIVAVMYSGRQNISEGDDNYYDYVRKITSKMSKFLCIEKLLEKKSDALKLYFAC